MQVFVILQKLHFISFLCIATYKGITFIGIIQNRFLNAVHYICTVWFDKSDCWRVRLQLQKDSLFYSLMFYIPVNWSIQYIISQFQKISEYWYYIHKTCLLIIGNRFTFSTDGIKLSYSSDIIIEAVVILCWYVRLKPWYIISMLWIWIA